MGLTFLAAPAAAGNDMVVGIVRWLPGQRSDANEYDQTDYWCCIALSPSSGKFAASCEWTNRDNAVRQARDKCNARDARGVVLCCNGWAALALGKASAGQETPWGVGWGEDEATAEKWALSGARDQGAADAPVVYAINAREIRSGGAIAFSPSTGRWGWATGGRSGQYNALKNCGADDATIVAQQYDCWLALAKGDDDTAYGVGWAGNKADAERNALSNCAKHTGHPHIELIFCTNGVTR